MQYVYLPELFRAEMLVAGHLRALMALPLAAAADPQRGDRPSEQSDGIRYAPAQRQAIAAALTNNCMVLTGGPGTGKTTAINAMIALFEQQADRVFLAAPTGPGGKADERTVRQGGQDHPSSSGGGLRRAGPDSVYPQ